MLTLQQPRSSGLFVYIFIYISNTALFTDSPNQKANVEVKNILPMTVIVLTLVVYCYPESVVLESSVKPSLGKPV